MFRHSASFLYKIYRQKTQENEKNARKMGKKRKKTQEKHLNFPKNGISHQQNVFEKLGDDTR